MSNNEKCYCKDRHAIVIDRRSASRVTSCVALGAFFVFATGYFIGKRHMLQDEFENQELALFANRIQYAIDEQCHITEAAVEQADSEQVILADNASESNVTQVDDIQEMPLITADMQRFKSQEKTNAQYVALLAGYGTQRAAQQFVDRLEKKGIKAEVKTRVSTNSQKKSRKWYQVATKKYDNKQELSALVELLKDQEHLGNDVRIVEIA